MKNATRNDDGTLAITPGDWKSDNQAVHGENGFPILTPFFEGQLNKRDEANLALAAEAGTVTNATGRTPAELVELVRELREAMQSVLCDPEGIPCFYGSDGDRQVIYEALKKSEGI